MNTRILQAGRNLISALMAVGYSRTDALAQMHKSIAFERQSHAFAIAQEMAVARRGSCNPCPGGYMIDSRGNYRENFGG